jgi:hypothetical protein
VVDDCNSQSQLGGHVHAWYECDEVGQQRYGAERHEAGHRDEAGLLRREALIRRGRQETKLDHHLTPDAYARMLASAMHQSTFQDRFCVHNV